MAQQITLTDIESSSLIERDKPICPDCGFVCKSHRGLVNHYAGKNDESHSEPYPWWEEIECLHCGGTIYQGDGTGHDKEQYCSKKCAANARAPSMRTAYAGHTLETGKGYERWITANTNPSVHQLLAVADGADPHKVYGNSKYSVDHINGCKIDNRPSNLQLMTNSEHGKKDAKRFVKMNEMEFEDFLSIIDFFTPLGRDPSWTNLE